MYIYTAEQKNKVPAVYNKPHAVDITGPSTENVPKRIHGTRGTSHATISTCIATAMCVYTRGSYYSRRRPRPNSHHEGGTLSLMQHSLAMPSHQIVRTCVHGVADGVVSQPNTPTLPCTFVCPCLCLSPLKCFMQMWIIEAKKAPLESSQRVNMIWPIRTKTIWPLS